MVFFHTLDGPELLCSTLNTIFTSNDYYQISTYFYIATGINDTRIYGLFEFPVYKFPDLHAFVYTFDIRYDLCIDTSAMKQNFCLLAIIFDKHLREFLPHPTLIETLIQYQLKSCTELTELYDVDIYKSILRYLEEYLESTNFSLYLERIKSELKMSSCTVI